MGRDRASRRHQLARRKARTRRILHRYDGGDAQYVSARRVGRFTASRWGCACELCVNPRKLWRGKTSHAEPRKEYHAKRAALPEQDREET